MAARIADIDAVRTRLQTLFMTLQVPSVSPAEAEDTQRMLLSNSRNRRALASRAQPPRSPQSAAAIDQYFISPASFSKTAIKRKLRAARGCSRAPPPSGSFSKCQATGVASIQHAQLHAMGRSAAEGPGGLARPDDIGRGLRADRELY